MRYVRNSATSFGAFIGNLIRKPTKQSKKGNLSGLLIMVSLAMHAKFDGLENVTSDLIPFLHSLNEVVDVSHSLAAWCLELRRTR